MHLACCWSMVHSLGLLLRRIKRDPRAVLMETCALVLLQRDIVLKEIVGPTSNPPCWTSNPTQPPRVEEDDRVGPQNPRECENRRPTKRIA